MSKLKTIRVIIIVFFFLVVTLFGYAQTPIGQGGTLIILVPNKDGLLITADKRSFDPIRKDTDKSIKLFQVNKFLAFSTTGIPTFLHDKTFEKLFCADDIVNNFFSSHYSLDKETLTSLAIELQTTFINFLSRLSFNIWPEDGSDFDNCLFQICFYQYDTASNYFRNVNIRFCYKKVYPKPFIQISSNETIKESFFSSKAMLFGNTAVYNELKNGNNSEFENLRNNELIKKFIISEKCNLVSKKEAIDFSKFFMNMSFSKTSLIDNSNNHIGSTVDIAIINKKNGFIWIEKNVSVKK